MVLSEAVLRCLEAGSQGDHDADVKAIVKQVQEAGSVLTLVRSHLSTPGTQINRCASGAH